MIAHSLSKAEAWQDCTMNSESAQCDQKLSTVPKINRPASDHFLGSHSNERKGNIFLYNPKFAYLFLLESTVTDPKDTQAEDSEHLDFSERL